MTWGATLAAALLLAARADTQQTRTVSLGHEMYAVMGATAGTTGDASVAAPQRNTFMVVTPGGNVIIDTSGPVVSTIHHRPIRRTLTRYRDAIQFVHDASVKRMNEGKDVFTLPSALEVGESYGRVSWSVRGIDDGYAGWFDGEPSSMYGSPSRASGEIVALAGGVGPIVARARALAETNPVVALDLTNLALDADPRNTSVLEVRIAILRVLAARSTNSNERGWLRAAIADAEARLKR